MCINAFQTDTGDEINPGPALCRAGGARCALSEQGPIGGEGSLEIADAVIDDC